MTLNMSFRQFNQYINNYPRNEDICLNESFQSNIYENIFDCNNSYESDEDAYNRYYISPKKSNKEETEAIQNMKYNEIIEKKEEKEEKNENKNNPPIILLVNGGIPSEEIIDGKSKNSKKKNKKRYTEKTEKTACSSEINKEPQNQINKENKEMSELNEIEINKEENNEQLIIVDKKEESKISNNNINVSNNNDNSEVNDITNIQANNIASNINNIITNINSSNNNDNSEVNDIYHLQTNNIRINEENNLNIIINSDNHDTDTNSSNCKNLIDKKRKRSNDLTNELNKVNLDKIRRKIRIMSLRTVVIFINKMIKIIYNNDIRKSILIRQFLEITKKELSHSSVDFDKKFLQKNLKEILSKNISEKYSNFPSDKNKRLVEELINSEIGGPYFQKLFELTFLDCLEHIRGTKIFNELIGLMDMEEMLNYEEFKIDKDEIDIYRDYIYRYEKIIEEKKSRNSKKEKI